MITKSTIRTTAAALLALGGTVFAAAEPIQPIEPAMGLDVAQVELGKKLFFDPRLSRSGFISCNSCHNLSMGGTDNLKSSIGHAWQQGPINSPTVLNSSLNVAQFWDGRAADLKEQAAGPIANPAEMAASHDLAVEVLTSIPQYEEEFEAVFGSPGIDIDRITTAIAEFEESLVTPGAPFDLWLQGDEGALTAAELQGYALFKQNGCIACHNGPAAGGNSFQKMGLVAPYETDNEAIGLAGVTGNEADEYKFKVPTLRNVEMTYPYFHDGGAATLTEAVDVMARVQLGKELTPEDTALMVAFLKTLTGEQPAFGLPILPPSTDATVRPAPFE
jgi:cytochrome c peroxidase